MEENKPKMILSLDDYNKLLNGSLKESEMSTCLLKFIVRCVEYDLNLTRKLNDLMTESGYSIITETSNGKAQFGEGDKIILLKTNRDA